MRLSLVEGLSGASGIGLGEVGLLLRAVSEGRSRGRGSLLLRRTHLGAGHWARHAIVVVSAAECSASRGSAYRATLAFDISCWCKQLLASRESRDGDY